MRRASCARARAAYAVRSRAVARTDEITSYPSSLRSREGFGDDRARFRRVRKRETSFDRKGEGRADSLASPLTHIAECSPVWQIRCPPGWAKSPKMAASWHPSKKPPPRRPRAPWISRKRTIPGTPSVNCSAITCIAGCYPERSAIADPFADQSVDPRVRFRFLLIAATRHVPRAVSTRRGTCARATTSRMSSSAEPRAESPRDRSPRRE